MALPQGFPQITMPVADPSGRITQPWFQLLISLWNRTGGSAGSAAFNAGDTKQSASSTVPEGWFLCDGSAISRTAYAGLFAAIGTTWGPGDGVTTFNIPDFRGRTLIGAGGAYAVGATGGAATTTLAVGNLPAHSHGVTDPQHTHVFAGTAHNHGITDPQHNHGITDPGHVHAALVAANTNTAGAAAGDVAAGNTGSAATGITVNNAATGVTVNNATATGTNAAAATGISIDNTGSGTPFSNLPPYAAVNWLIKA